MDEDLNQTMREQVAASNRKIGLSFDDAHKTTMYSQALLDQYRLIESSTSGVAAFRLDAFLTEPSNHPVREAHLNSIAEALRFRISNHTMAESDLRIGLALHSFGSFDRRDVALLVAAMKGSCDFSLVSEAPRLLPIVGAEFIQSYLTSTELFETGGMGGPQRPLIREMAEEAYTNFNAKK
ncbi:MAG: hypothetical protein ABIS50_13640 [Luteolibacter sp.]|uniref:hypothetical protein n=1 Tax=Luteolibacter sp. TaxID=1962973 RepID=UPI003264E1A6